MSKSSGSKVSFATITTDLVIVGVVWLLFALWFKPHVMVTYETSSAFLWAGFSALPAAGTFFLCLQMFKVTLAHQRTLKKERSERKTKA